MLFSLGERTRSGDVVDLLLACHHRVREHLAIARRLAQAPAEPPLDSIRAAACRVRTYFSTAFRLHRQDEEQDIFPRLLGRSDELDAAVGELLHDHEDHERHIAAIVELCAVLEHHPSRLPAVAADLAEHVHVLEGELTAHILLEEQTMFPAIAKMSEAEREQIHECMRARRR